MILLTLLMSSILIFENFLFNRIRTLNSTARKLTIHQCMGKITIQLISHRESEIAWKLSEIPR